MSKIDWDAPIEGVNGEEAEIVRHPHEHPKTWENCYDVVIGSTRRTVTLDGNSALDLEPLVRNVTEPKVGIEAWAIKIALDAINDFPTGAGVGSKWTMEEIMDTSNGALRYQAAVQVLARYIAQHEEAPVDPDRIAARQICEDHGIANPFGAEESLALAAIKRGRELERGEVK